MEQVERKIAHSFAMVKRDIVQLQQGFLDLDRTEKQFADVVVSHDATLKKHTDMLADVKLRLGEREKGASKTKGDLTHKVKVHEHTIRELKLALKESEKVAKSAVRDVTRLAKKVEKLTERMKKK